MATGEVARAYHGNSNYLSEELIYSDINIRSLHCWGRLLPRSTTEDRQTLAACIGSFCVFSASTAGYMRHKMNEVESRMSASTVGLTLFRIADKSS